MPKDIHDGVSQTPAGLIAGLGAVTRNGIGLLLSRLELAALEIAEAREQLLKLALAFALAILAAWFAIAYGSVLLIYFAWPYWGWKSLLILTLIFCALAVALLYYIHRLLQRGGLGLPVTMSELKVDREMFL